MPVRATVPAVLLILAVLGLPAFGQPPAVEVCKGRGGMLKVGITFGSSNSRCCCRSGRTATT